MFLVSDGRLGHRRTVARHAADDLSVGVILAAIDFEWTCRRCILALGIEPTIQMKQEFAVEKWFGRELKDAWRDKMVSRGHVALNEVFDVWAKDNCTCYIVWQDLMHAFDIRNQLVHGVRGVVSKTDGRTCINVFETACDILCQYAMEKGRMDERSIFKRIARYGQRNQSTVRQPKRRERDFAGASDGELLIEGVRVKAKCIPEIAKGKVKKDCARNIFVSLRSIFKEW